MTTSCLAKLWRIRNRFYQGAIDIDFMDKNYSYKILPESRVIFICTFDPFKLGLSRYTFRERCDENPEICLNDGTEKVFYNCKYEGEDIPDGIRNLYEFIGTGNASDELTEKLNSAVAKAHKNEIWRTQYMKEWVVIQDARDEGREEGREETIIRKVCLKLRKGKEIWQIADELEEDETRIKVICDAIESFAPDYDEERVVEWMQQGASVSQ